MHTERTRSKDMAIKTAIGALEYFHPVPMGVEDFLRSHTRLLHVNRGEIIQHKGNVCRDYYMIISGAIRGYSESEHGDVTTWISTEHDMVASIHSLHDQQPMLENMQAIEESVLLAISLQDMEALYEHVPLMNVIVRKLLQKYYGDAEIRALLARISHAENKYAFFLEYFPQLANRIPLKIIASFLGIRYETLSRIRKKRLQDH